VRTLSLTLREAMFSQETGEVPVFLLTITHPDLDDPILVSSDPTARLSTDPLVYGTTSRGDDYLFVGMRVQMPDERDQGAPQARLVISNVDRGIMPLVRSVDSPASAKIEIVLASDPDTVEATVPALDMSAAEWNAEEITFDLTMDAQVTEPYPAGSFDPASFPALF
jgi:hypothetical protein